MTDTKKTGFLNAHGACFVPSTNIDEGLRPVVHGYDWVRGNDANCILDSYKTTGFQATNFGLGVDVINQMIQARAERVYDDVEKAEVQGCTIFLGFTSNIVSSGLRETIRFLVQHKLVDCIVTTAGGVEEDLMKCLAPTLVGGSNLNGESLRNQRLNGIVNKIVPNDNYCSFEFQNWLTPILDEMLNAQETQKVIWTPSRMIAKLGEKIQNEDSIYYWAWKNSIPVFSASLADGSLFFHSSRKPGLIIDILGDIRAIGSISTRAKKSGVMVIGGDEVKHHICNADLMRNGSDFAVFINTGQEFDGSDSGARPDEAVSWGKIKPGGQSVKICTEATLVFSLLVSRTFAKQVYKTSQNVTAILDSYKTTGFQATNFGLGVDVINQMIQARAERIYNDVEKCIVRGCTIFLGFTSNIVSSGLRETIRFLVQHKLVDCVVTTAGGIEEDFIKCLAPTLVGDFNLNGESLRKQGLNRIGNLIVPNDNYCSFENWVTPILDEMVDAQAAQKQAWTPSKIIAKLGEKIRNKDSIYYWTWKNSIPVFCPALTDGSLGDMMFFHRFRKRGLTIDILDDLEAINTIAMKAKKSGVIVIGGSVPKHHICNANLMRNGSDFAVFINTGQEFDGSDSGARPDEAVSWGKIKPGGQSIKIYAEATLVFPLIVSQTFAKQVYKTGKIN